MKLEDLIDISSKKIGLKIDNLSFDPNDNLIENIGTTHDVTNQFPDYLLEDPMVVGYPDIDMQNAIYDYARKDLIDFFGLSRDLTVVDVGCGRGDLRTSLKEYYEDIRYIGFELNSIHVRAAKKKYNIDLLNEDFRNSSIECDWIFFIGSLNEDYDMGPQYGYFDELLNHSLSSSCKGMTFILLNEEELGLVSYPVQTITNWISNKYPNLAYNVNFSSFQGLYKLTVFNKYLV